MYDLDLTSIYEVIQQGSSSISTGLYAESFARSSYANSFGYKTVKILLKSDVRLLRNCKFSSGCFSPLPLLGYLRVAKTLYLCMSVEEDGPIVRWCMKCLQWWTNHNVMYGIFKKNGSIVRLCIWILNEDWPLVIKRSVDVSVVYDESVDIAQNQFHEKSINLQISTIQRFSFFRALLTTQSWSSIRLMAFAIVLGLSSTCTDCVYESYFSWHSLTSLWAPY